MKSNELDNYYINVAKLCAQNSKANKLKVGAILVKNQQIISDGFNGTPHGFDNTCEICKHINECTEKRCNNCNKIELITKPYVIHAESNCLMKAARNGNATLGTTMYITHAPCIECAKQIIQSGVKRVVYAYPYKTFDGINLLKQAGIFVNNIHD